MTVKYDLLFAWSLHEFESIVEQHTNTFVRKLINKSIDILKMPFTNPIVQFKISKFSDIAETVVVLRL